MKFNRTLLVPLGILALVCSASGVRAQITFSASDVLPGGVVVPDAPLAGVARSLTVSTPADTMTALSINLDIGSVPNDTAWNGDLYAQLTSPSGTLAVLINRPGVDAPGDAGYSDQGFSVTIAAAPAPDIHFYHATAFTLNSAGQVTGTWGSDGRFDPTSSARPQPLSSLLGENPNGTWTLFVGDMASGNQAQLNSWSISGTGAAVPEPGLSATLIASALLVFACVRPSVFSGRHGRRQ